MSAGPTDDFWLTAYDGVNGSRLIGDRSLGIGLATGLLAELVHGKWCQLFDGELFRTTAPPPRDAALGALLAKMEEDEQDWPSPPATAAPESRTYVAAHAWPPQGQVWPSATRAGGGWPPVPQETRPVGRGHQVREWMSYLANKNRAETLVGDRLAHRGLVWREERGRVFKTVRYVPCDSVVTGNPASMISAATQRGIDLPWSGRLLAALFLATGLDQHALASLTPPCRSSLLYQIRGLDEKSRELLLAAHTAVGNAAAIR